MNGNEGQAGCQDCIGNPYLNPAKIESVARSQPGGGESGRTHGDHAPSRHRGEGGGTLHRLPDEAQIVNRTVVEGAGAATHFCCAGAEPAGAVLISLGGAMLVALRRMRA